MDGTTCTAVSEVCRSRFSRQMPQSMWATPEDQCSIRTGVSWASSSQILSQSGGFEGIGFAVSSKVARELLLSQQLFWSGVDGYLLTDALARAFNIPQPAGLLIQHVAEGSPGAAMGLRAGTMRVKVGDELLLAGGDIVLSVAGVVVADDDAVLDRVRARSPGLAQWSSLCCARGRSRRYGRAESASPARIVRSAGGGADPSTVAACVTT